MRVLVIGDGSFGKYLQDFLKNSVGVELDQECTFGVPDTVFLAVPFSAYKEVASKYQGKHLVNVCSVQEETNKICQLYSDRVTGIHPLFGARTPINSHKHCILTLATGAHSMDIINMFESISKITYKDSAGRYIDGKYHDEIMAKVHKPVIGITDEILSMVKDAQHVPEHLLPPSFKKMRELAEQFTDMPEGTRESILANKYE